MLKSPTTATPLFVIVDYNLSRMQDVQIMAQHAKSAYGVTTVLIRAQPRFVDRQLVDHVIDLDPLTPLFVERACKALNSIGEPRAILPFSDNAVVSGAELASAYDLVADSADLATAAFSKIAYREAEAKLLQAMPQDNIMAPLWSRVTNREEAENFARRTTRGLVIKPSCEGNNRGVVKLEKGGDLGAAFSEVQPYLQGGALCEEIIDFPAEFSFDGIGHLSFITEKSSAAGRYPVEYGQTVPARLPSAAQEAIRRAGAMANVIVGQRHGPFHNEVKFDAAVCQAAVIEPNRRPAGMRIWHLAERVFGVNLFTLWVDRLLGGASLMPKRLEPRGIASIRMLAAPHTGVLRSLPSADALLKAILHHPDLVYLSAAHGLEWFDFAITSQAGATVSDLIDDNSKFMAQICVYAKDDATNIHGILNIFDAAWRDIIADYIVPSQSLALARG